MDRQTRLSRMAQALEKLATSGQEGDFLIFADVTTRDYVQFMRVPFLGEGAEPALFYVSVPLTDDPAVPKAQWEVSDRGLYAGKPSSNLPPLSRVQVAAIEVEALG